MSAIKGASSPITTQLQSNSEFLISQSLWPDPAPGTTIKPQAGLHFLFFDERFNFVDSYDAMVVQPGDGVPPLVIAQKKAPKNGYCYVYISNESQEPPPSGAGLLLE